LCISLPDLEKQGGNLTVECILRGINFAMKEREIDYIRNLYIQLDNVSSNKCFTIYSVLIELIKNGIFKKVKVSYLIVGHTHEDIDALIGIQNIFILAIILSRLHIGSIVTKLRVQDISTIEEFKQKVLAALKTSHGKVKDVQVVLGIPDYDKMFCQIMPDIKGMKAI